MFDIICVVGVVHQRPKSNALHQVVLEFVVIIDFALCGCISATFVHMQCFSVVRVVSCGRVCGQVQHHLLRSANTTPTTSTTTTSTITTTTFSWTSPRCINGNHTFVALRLHFASMMQPMMNRAVVVAPRVGAIMKTNWEMWRSRSVATCSPTVCVIITPQFISLEGIAECLVSMTRVICHMGARSGAHPGGGRKRTVCQRTRATL